MNAVLRQHEAMARGDLVRDARHSQEMVRVSSEATLSKHRRHRHQKLVGTSNLGRMRLLMPLALVALATVARPATAAPGMAKWLATMRGGASFAPGETVDGLGIKTSAYEEQEPDFKAVEAETMQQWYATVSGGRALGADSSVLIQARSLNDDDGEVDDTQALAKRQGRVGVSHANPNSAVGKLAAEDGSEGDSTTNGMVMLPNVDSGAAASGGGAPVASAAAPAATATAAAPAAPPAKATASVAAAAPTSATPPMALLPVAASSMLASSSVPAVMPVSTSTPPSSSPTPSSSSKAQPTSTNKSDKQEAAVSSNPFSPSNKLFPAMIAACVAGGILCAFVAIWIARTVAHHRMRQEEMAALYGEGPDGKLTAAGKNFKGRRSMRRAMTTKKLGSFARRNKQGSVLIDVGDEVFAVTPQVAEEYERCRAFALSSSGSSGSSSAFNAKKALRDAESKAVEASAQQDPFKRRGSQPEVVDIASWRQALSEQAHKSGAPDLDKIVGDSNPTVGRSLSQRLVRGLKALRGGAKEEDEEEASSGSSGSGSSMPEKDPRSGGLVPVVSRGANAGWSIEAHQPSRQAHLNPSSDPRDAPLSHARISLSDGPMGQSRNVQNPVAHRWQQQQREAGMGPDALPPHLHAAAARRSAVQQQSSGATRGATHRQKKPSPLGGDSAGVSRSKTMARPSSRAPNSAGVIPQTVDVRPGAVRRGQTTVSGSPYLLDQRHSRPLAPGTVVPPSQPSLARLAAEEARPHSDLQRAKSFRPLPLPPALGTMSPFMREQ